MRIVHVITSLNIGGAEMMLYKLLAGSGRNRFSHSVISMLDEGAIGRKIKSLGLPVYALNMRRSLLSLPAVFELARMVRSIRPDIIQGWMYHGNLFSSMASKLLTRRIPVVWNIRQSLYSLSYEKRMTRMVIRCGARLSSQPARILYNSLTGAAHHEGAGYKADKRIVIQNGFDTEVFAPSEYARYTVRKELGLDANILLIGLIGRYHAVKDHETFLNAAALLRNQYSSVHFLLAGKDVTQQNKQLSSQIHDLDLFDNVHLLGERDDIPRLTAALDCAALSSFSEGFPNVVGEAMSSGVPCVVTDVGDAAWVVGDTGIVVPPRNADALALALGKMIEMKAEARRALGRRARRRIMDRFSLAAVVQAYEQLYEGLAC